MAVEYVGIEKPSPGTEELTLTERLLTVGRKPDHALPSRVVVDKGRDPNGKTRDRRGA